LDFTFDIAQFGLRLLGAFYAFAGYIAARAGLTSRLMDHAIAAIGGAKPDPRETQQSLWLLVGSVIIFAGGAALFLLLDVAPWLFAASAISQAFYLLVLAPRYFDVVDPPDERGRRQSTNAFLIYTVVTFLVIWATANGKLVPWQDMPWPLRVAFVAAVAAHAGYVAWYFLRPLKSAAPVTYFGGRASFDGEGSLGDEPSDTIEQRNPAQSRAIKVMADYDCHPLWALDEDLVGDFPPEDIGVSAELCRDLKEWAQSFNASLDRENPADTLVTPEEHAAHEQKGRQLAIRIARERPDLEIYAYETATGVVRVYARDAL
jgi:hypothetical protein